MNLSNIFREKQEHYFKFSILILLFLLLAFDQDLGMIYMLIMVGDIIWFLFDKDGLQFPLNRGVKNGGPSNLQVFLETLFALGLFLLISSFIQGFVANFLKGTQSVFELLATGTPILKGNIFLTIIGWGFLVPLIETSFFNGRLLEGFGTYAENIYNVKIDFKKITLPLVILMFFIGALFALFHITAKGASTVPLMVTVLFSIISSILVIRHRELKAGVLLHVIVNSMAVLTGLGVIFK